MVRMPAHLTFVEAASTPTVFITVDAALSHAAGCIPGERVLVHGAAGGVGLAALQMAKALVAQAVRHMQLVGRTAHVATSANVTALLSCGSAAAVTLSMADLGTTEGAADVFACCQAGKNSASLQGIMHAGGTLADGTLANQTMQGIRDVFAAKGWRGRMPAPQCA
ncbi:hypothetical protein WJX72_002745 [[Myrmecia] bisecta]|uniref:Ketoreductase (KR) domain-containing protein n=1 Tax=[Myrmecia] bisecta TaxID=41462 RepID=A0AAW1PZZ6_9CHLO